MTMATPVRPTSSSAYIDLPVATGGPATVHGNTSDDDDSSYITTDGAGVDGAYITFTSPSALPSGAVSSRIQLRARTAVPGELSASGIGSISGGGFVSIGWFTPSTHQIYSAAQSSWPSSPQILLTLGPPAYLPRVYELYLDCHYVAQPTVTVQEPTVANLNRPTIQWAAGFDSEGGSQTHYEVKIYASPYTGAPTGGSPADQSGEVSGGGNSWRGEVALSNATYKAYVRVAQTVNGSQHWSAWDDEDFVISVTAAPTPTLSVSDDASNGRIAISVNSGGATTHIIQIQRSTDGGTTWEDVRTSEGDGVISDWSATPDLYDYEVPNGTAASYRARAGRLYTDFYAYSAWTSTASDTWTSTDYWLKHPYDPTLNEAIALKASGTIERAGRMGVHQPLGEADTVAITDLPRSATGEFEIFAHTEADRAPLEALLESGDPLLFQSPSAAALDDRWIVPGGWTRTRVVDHTGYPREVYSVSWSEVATPEGNFE